VVLKIIEAGPVLKSSIAVVQWQPWEGQEDPIPAQAKKGSNIGHSMLKVAYKGASQTTPQPSEDISPER